MSTPFPLLIPSTSSPVCSSNQSAVLGTRLDRRVRTHHLYTSLSVSDRQFFRTTPCASATSTTSPSNEGGGANAGGPALIRHGVLTIGSLALTISLEQAAVRFLRANSIQFPGSLCAMLVLLGSITLLRVLRLTKAAEGLRTLFTPATAFLTRWLAVFFVPNLVMLPLAPKLPSADVAKIAIILVFGFVASLLSTAAIALGLRSIVAKIRGSPAKAAPASVSGGSSGPSNGLLLVLALGGLVSLPIAAASGSAIAPAAGTLYALCATMFAFCIGQRAPKPVRSVLHPLVVCTVGALGALTVLSTLSGTPLATVLGSYYARGAGSLSEWGAGNMLAALLGPAVVSFALQMDSRRALVRARGPELVGTSLLATVVGLFGTAAVARGLSMTPDARLMVVPRMITAPLAAAIVDMLGTQPGVALSVVAITGLLGANIAMPMLSAARVRDPVVRGLATGAAAHGLGTAAMADEPAAFPFAAIAMTLVGIFATCMVASPPIRALLLRVALGRVSNAPVPVA